MEEYIKKIRRHIHRNPELGFETYNTAKYLYNELTLLGYNPIYDMNNAALIAELNLNKKKTLGFRTDLDALKIKEETDLEFKSTNNLMHACGHDGHIATLMGAAKLLIENKDKLKYNIILIFQPAEEGPLPGGAYYLKNNPILKKVDYFFAYHVTNNFKVGEIAIKKGEAWASPDLWELELCGLGCHASTPEYGKNPLIAVSEIILELEKAYQELKKRENIVITTTYISGGISMNIIPDKAYIKGTARSFNEKMRKYLKDLMTDIIETICNKYNIEYKFDFHFAYPAGFNDKKNIEMVKKAASNANIKFIKLNEPVLIGEDFAYYREIAPICLTWLGVREENEPFYDLHNPKFIVSERALEYGAKIIYNIASGDEIID